MMGFFLFAPRSDRLLGPPRIEWVMGALTPGIKRPGREADNSPPSDAGE
jgi:hypothetical protein